MDRRVSVAPMLDWTTRHARFFLRLISKEVLLYTEMITTGALIHGDRARFLKYDASEHPLAIQLGGSDPAALAQCAVMAEEAGYDEVNLNVGCPSDRVQNGRFGACLMAEPELVAACVAAMRAKVSIPVTVKTRIGIDEQDSYAFLTRFIKTVAEAGCDVFIIHARKAWLQGLSPKENREVPPLRYDVVKQLKQDFPALTLVLNGGIKTVAEVQTHLADFDGVMLGREAYQNPYILAELEQAVYQKTVAQTRHDIVQQLIPYIRQEMASGVPLKSITRHILGLFRKQPGARQWRRFLSEKAHLAGAEASLLSEALDLVKV